MDICTQNQKTVSKSHDRHHVLSDYIRSMVRREFLQLYMDTSSDLVQNEEVILRGYWKALREWAAPFGAADLAVRRSIVNDLTGMLISTAREYPDVPKMQKTIVIHRLLSKGFPGLFSEAAEEEDLVQAA